MSSEIMISTTNSYEKIIKLIEQIDSMASLECNPLITQELLNEVRFLRNSCAKGSELQYHIASLPNFFQTIFSLISKTDQEPCHLEENFHVLKMLLWQLLVNITTNPITKDNTTTQMIFWENCEAHIIGLLKNELSTHTDLQLMIINNLFKSNYALFLDARQMFLIILNVWSNLLKEKNEKINLEFMHIIFQDFLCRNNDILPLYNSLDDEKRILTLKYISTYIRNESPNGSIQEKLMKYLSKEFKKKSDCILRIDSSHINNLNPNEVMALLDIIAKSTVDDIYKHIYSSDHSLFINVGSLLQASNELGTKSNNIFTPMEKLVEVAPNSSINTNYQDEISYQLRTRLVQILSNLLHRNPQNQIYAREMKIIPAILNCTRLDARNPMMREWSIIAIRNLCENCPENQEIISQLTKIDNSNANLLTELNLDLGTLRIKPAE